MKLVVYGASRGLGKFIVEQALERAHEVTAFSRNPAKLHLEHPKLTLVADDVRDAHAVASATQGQDAAFCALGLPTLKAMGYKREQVISAGTKNIVAALQHHRVPRFICETAIGTGDSAQNCKPLLRLAMRVGLHHLFHEKDRQEEIVRQSGLKWVLVRPTAMTFGAQTTRAQVLNQVKAGAFTHVSRADVASFMLDQLTSDDYLGQAVIVSYQPRRLADPILFAKDFKPPKMI